jgi:hypothetical protein
VRAGAHAAAGHWWAHEAVCQHTGAVGGRRSAVRGVRLIWRRSSAVRARRGS